MPTPQDSGAPRGQRGLRLSIATISLPLVLAGCGGIGDSLKLSNAVLVKVPTAAPVAGKEARGWQFRHVLQAPNSDGRAGEWYVAWNNARPLRGASWSTLHARAPEIADAAAEALKAYPVLIEPNKTFTRVAAKEPAEPKKGEEVKSQFGSGTRLVVTKRPMKVWPDDRRPSATHPGEFEIDPMWHLDDRHSQLARARSQFARPGDGITIGHLDNGLDGRHAAAPMKLARNDRRADAVGQLEYEQKLSRGEKAEPPIAPERTGGTHGLGTIGLLAGSWVAIDEQKVPGGRIKGYYGWLGGAPYATVVPIRVAPWVFSASTGELAYGIDYASRVKGCDVITMSHGGSPTQAWADAVNAAYERGTAIFAAESDFYSLVPTPFRPNGIILPSSLVYPAGFRRVVGVTGVTADEKSYAQNTVGRLLSWPPALLQWMSRGSFGADGTSTALLRPTRKADPSQFFRVGALHPHPVAAYAPNVPWISIRKVKGQPYADGVDLTGAGTSAATPQAAAAAALWLQKHRREFSEAEWRGWQKSEAVYQAILKSADPHDRTTPDDYLGAGPLRAYDALQLSYADIKRSQRPPGRLKEEDVPPRSLWFGKAPNDYYDGARSFLGLLGLTPPGHVPLECRALLRQTPEPHEKREKALQRLFFNMALLREWHSGKIPRKGTEERQVSDRAWRDACRAPASKQATR